MSNVEEIISDQTQLMYSVARVLPNFKKLGQARITRAATKERLANLKVIFSKCQELHSKITRLASDTQKQQLPYFKEQQFFACEDVFNETSDYMAEILEAFEPGPRHQSTALDVSNPSEFSRQSSHLPKLHLPTFEGGFDKWENFRDRFTSLIANDTSLSNVDRLHYLCSCVKGEASKALSHLAITDANYVVAWNLLISRYENKRRLITGHLQTLVDLPAVPSKNSKDLRYLCDQTNAAIHALKNLGRPVEHWDDLLVFLVSQKLDKSTREAWEIKLGETSEYPRFKDLTQFIDTRIRAFDAIAPANPKEKASESNKPAKRHVLASNSGVPANVTCPVCKAKHLLYQCSTFASKTPSERFELIRLNRRCINCFSAKHVVRECTSPRTCKHCQKKHHSLLHFDTSANQGDTVESAVATTSSDSINSDVTTHLSTNMVSPQAAILLATARVRVHSPQGRVVTVRALIDQGSAVTLITESIAQCLRLPRVKQAVRIAGIGDKQSVSHHAVTVIVTPAFGDEPAYSTTALVLHCLTKYTPNRTNSACRWSHISGLRLADGDLMSRDPIDVIIGADLYGLILFDGIRKGSVNEPTAQKTTLGWILSGPVTPISTNPRASVQVHHGIVFESLDSILRKFWEIEDIPLSSFPNPEDFECEAHFSSTHYRTPQGRYVVRLPFKGHTAFSLGESRAVAFASLQRLERRFLRQPETASAYREFLTEYRQLGHMTIAPTDNCRGNAFHRYYIPHHAVVRDSSATTRLRVVFNASCRTSDGTSLNDHLMVGPKLQLDLATVLMRWLDEYQLLTVTYGTASAPYLALRVVRQLTQDEGASFPLAVPVLLSQLYVDDSVFGADDKILARQTRDQLVALLEKGGFRLRKWASNCEDLLSDIDPSDHGLACSKELYDDERLSVLGLTWDPCRDVFRVKVSLPTHISKTKREILSTIARLFDPLGWITPVVITAKIFLQTLWQLKCDWDDDNPGDYATDWERYYSQLSCLHQLEIARWTRYGSHTLKTELHGFSDASTKAYAAVVYLRNINIDGSVDVFLLAAKSKVAPLKTLSVPRLELAAAHLLSRLVQFVRTTLQLPNIEIHCWTDSTITLAWLSKSPSCWQTFVANRVAAIQTTLPDIPWRHVPTYDNAADAASRGLAPDELALHPLWWHGPPWLSLPPTSWPNGNLIQDEITSIDLLEKRNVHVADSPAPPELWDLAFRFSSWPKLLRVTSYLIRFGNLARQRNQSLERSSRVDEIAAAKAYWLRCIQAAMFPAELVCLAAKRSKSSPLSSLNPSLSDDGLIRVRGRLRHARLPDSTKYPIVFRSHPLLFLIIDHHHHRMLHGGSQLTLASLRSEFWILRARTCTRAVLHKCVRCVREAATIPNELMGDLPSVRVNRAARPFSHTGVDYAGPILLRSTPGRGHKSHKAYIALFVCLSTKAIHLEVVTDYTSATFIAAYHRFVSRRGLPQGMYCDNGTTFQGADRELADAHRRALRDPNFIEATACEKTSWHFLPPAAPHFGGLWEAGVRSVKTHLKRCIGAHTLTYEEMNTLLCKIEACLNSRPLSAVSENLEDYRGLTPGHFLIGAPLAAFPEPSVLDLHENRLSRWQMTQRITEGFWRSWRNDYLLTLQQRPKWRIVQKLARIGQLVLLRNPQAPPSQWELGRIVACHPGADGLTRVVTVRTSRAEYKRPITKICYLPVDINQEMSMTSGSAGGDKK
ncbi:uncharacterized protein LOC114941055 [Nylanderia fulva]|uniref:uncharacterized protein LOC114941055 n=1 Tax=Nylanderia fulva TaxID=613905 RepID=UPI0010FB4001|nr:uncharacterized protein LOC114941055 [Nylanderia fulva]